MRASLGAAPLIAAIAAAAWPCAALAATPDPLQPWRTAAGRADAQALADLTVLPFLYEGRALDRAQYIAQAVPALFTPAVRRCLQRVPAQAEDGALVLWCRPYGFYLRHAGGAWRLTDFVADPP